MRQLVTEHDEPVDGRLGLSFGRGGGEAWLMQFAEEVEVAEQRTVVVERDGLGACTVENVQARLFKLKYFCTDEQYTRKLV